MLVSEPAIAYQATSTYNDIFTTETFTEIDTVRTTPVTTVTVTLTAGQKVKRDSAVTQAPVPRSLSPLQVKDVFASFRRDTAGNSSSVNDTQLSASFSSACACQTYGGSTVTETYTDEPVVSTSRVTDEARY